MSEREQLLLSAKQTGEALGVGERSVWRADANERGFSKRTLSRARQDIGAEAKKLGFSGGWRWSLPKAP